MARHSFLYSVAKNNVRPLTIAILLPNEIQLRPKMVYSYYPWSGDAPNLPFGLGRVQFKIFLCRFHREYVFPILQPLSPQSQRFDMITVLSVFPQQMFKCAPFFSAPSSNPYSWDRICHFHRVESPIFPLYKHKKKVILVVLFSQELLPCGTDSHVCVSLISTIIISLSQE